MLSAKEILKATNGKCLTCQKDLKFTGISTDTRRSIKGSLYIPLVGKRFDGHAFILKALKMGAVGALTAKTIKNIPPTKTVIKVKDTLKALQQIARYHRERYQVPVIGITGSSGKTTTKDMLASIFSLAGKTLKTEENYNNEIGVPQTLLKLDKKHKYCVIEMAMQGLKEIEELAWISLPNIAVITNIGSAHMEHLKSENNIAKAKSEILKFQKKNDFAVLPADDKFFHYLKKESKGKVVSFGIDAAADVIAKNIKLSAGSSSFVIDTKKFQITLEIPLPGKHNIYDALAAATAACAAGIKTEHIKKGLENFKLSGKRLNIIRFKGMTIIDDTYNANPDSMAASLGILENYPPRRIAVIGDMFELGRITKKSHENIGRLAAELNIEVLVTVGKLSEHTAASARAGGLKNVHSTRTNKEAAKILAKMVKPSDTVLIKGSRGMHMEYIAEELAKAR